MPPARKPGCYYYVIEHLFRQSVCVRFFISLLLYEQYCAALPKQPRICAEYKAMQLQAWLLSLLMRMRLNATAVTSQFCQLSQIYYLVIFCEWVVMA